LGPYGRAMVDSHLAKSRRLPDGRWLTWFVTVRSAGDGLPTSVVTGGRLDGVPITDERLAQLLLAVA
jgi:hypothetical protein